MNEKPVILVVDDDEAERYMTARFLHQAGFDILEAATGEDALEKVRLQPDLIVLDVNLPGINGFEVCRRIRETPAVAHIPVLHLSATYKDTEAVVKGLNTGADSYLTHPVEPPVLIAMIRALLRARRAERELAELNRNLEARVGARTLELQETTRRLKREIAERKRTQTRLEQANENLQDFIFVASHDLQEPLRKIQTFGSWLRKHDSQSPGQEEINYWERMDAAVARMQGQIEDLVTLSRITTRARPFEQVDLKDAAQAALNDLSPQIRQTDAQINIGYLPVLEAEPVQMQQLFYNLIDNGLKFHREAPRIEIWGEMEQGRRAMCRIIVKDNGIGFEEKFLDRIFRVFQRLHSRDEYTGRGIGLAICKKIAERHKGRITAQSKPGEGSTFVFTLPVRQ